VTFTPSKDIHCADAGASGTGKSVAAQALIYGAAVKGSDIYIIDPMKEAADFKFIEPYAEHLPPPWLMPPPH